jgi:hypothetical protein
MDQFVKQKRYFIFSIFKSRFCWLSLVLSFFIGYFLVPDKIFHGVWSVFGLVYAITFAVTLTCLIRVIKEKVLTMKKTGAGVMSVVAAILGLGAMQLCGIGAPVCGATIGVSIFSIIAPGISASFWQEFSTPLLFISIILQVVSLYYLKCFKKV